MNVLSLFDGMSCGRVALERAGIDVTNYFASEVDKYAIQVAQSNYADIEHVGDVTQLYGFELPKIDLLIGGSPCQGFSFAGKRLAFDDPRSKLFFEYVRLLKECEPEYFLLENVRMKKEYQDIISEYLGVEPIRINSRLVSAQRRDRFYWTNIPGVQRPKDKNIATLSVLEGDLLGKVSATVGASDDRVFRETKHFGCLTATMYKGARAAGRPIVASRAVMGHHMDSCGKESYRMVSPLECERLQTLPEGYTKSVSNTQRYKMLGNGWTVDVIAHIFDSLYLLT